MLAAVVKNMCPAKLSMLSMLGRGLACVAAFTLITASRFSLDSNRVQWRLTRAVEDSSAKAFYAFKISPRIGVFMTDNRVERSLHR